MKSKVCSVFVTGFCVVLLILQGEVENMFSFLFLCFVVVVFTGVKVCSVFVTGCCVVLILQRRR